MCRVWAGVAVRVPWLACISVLVTVSRSKVSALVRGSIRLGVDVIVLVSHGVLISFVIMVCCVRASAAVGVLKRLKVLVELRVGVSVLVSNPVQITLLIIVLVTPVARPLVIILSRTLASVPVGDSRGSGSRVRLKGGAVGIVSRWVRISFVITECCVRLGKLGYVCSAEIGLVRVSVSQK